MTRRKEKKVQREHDAAAKARINKLISYGWITNASEIPTDAIPVDPELINLGGSYFRPTFYQAIDFSCIDCNLPQTWQAEDQRWYYETTGAPYYSTAVRCRSCRQKERERKKLARSTPSRATKN